MIERNISKRHIRLYGDAMERGLREALISEGYNVSAKVDIVESSYWIIGF